MISICSYLSLILFLKIVHNTVMIYKTRNRSNDTAESQKEKKARFNAHFQYSQSKITELNKMWSLKRLAMLKRESRASQHVVKFK